MASNPRNQIIWLTSYPKSGNTWVRFLLANLLQDKPKTLAEVEQRIPDIHMCLSGKNGSSMETIFQQDSALVKSHFSLSPEMPLFENTMGFIYIVRHPLDMIVSNLNYVFLLAYGQLTEKLSQEQVALFVSEYIDKFIHLKGDERWIELGMGTLERHVESWLENPYGFRNIVIKYEDLLVNTGREVRRICTFLDIDVSDERIQGAITNSSFSEIKKVEERTIECKEPGMFYQPNYEAAHNSGIRFMNQGKTGEGKKRLSADQIERARKAFLPLMERFGYL